MAVILHTTDRTLRRYTDSTTLNTEQSERIIELAKLYTFGSDVFDGLENFKEWINQPLTALNSSSPKSYLDTSLGIKLLMQLLNRIEHGIYS
jgi:putative toxin-antitoxin system antitoxin component (TIGR02293 family)